jgi:hypothetical protein
MQLPRFRLRTLMIVVAVVGLMLCVARWDNRPVSLGVGHHPIPLTFFVSDTERGLAIPGATIDLVDLDYADIPTPPQVLHLRTGPDGRVTIPLTLQFTEVATPEGELISMSIRYPFWEVKVAADGYETAKRAFVDYHRGNPRFHSPSPPPPVVFRLHRR